MERKSKIIPNAMNVLCGGHKQCSLPYTQFDPPPTPEPKKKGFWGWLKDKTKKLCAGVKEFCIEAKELLTVATGVVISATGLSMAIKKSRKKKYKDSHKKSGKKNRKTQITYNINIGTCMVWA